MPKSTKREGSVSERVHRGSLKLGDEIKLMESGFIALFKAFFAEVEAKFV